MKSIWKENRILVIISIISISISSFAAIGLEYLKGSLIDYGINKNIDLFIKVAIVLFIIIAIKSFTHYLYSSKFMKFKVNAMSKLRGSLFKSILKRNYPEYLKKNTGEYFSVYTNQINSLEMTYFGAIWGIMQILTELLVSFIFLYIINPKLFFYGFITLIPSLLVPKFAAKYLIKARKDMICKMDENLTKLKEYLSGFEIIKTYNKINIFTDKFYQSTSIFEDSVYKMSKTNSMFQQLSNLLVNLSAVVIIAVSVFNVADGKITIGQFVASYGIIAQLTTQVVYISTYVQELISVRVVIKNIFDFIKLDDSVEKSIEIKEIEKIEFDNISFSYDDKELIKNFNYIFKKPGIYQLMGESGSGKSTLLSLLFNYYEPNIGKISINGKNVSEIKNLSEIITVMRQEAIFFDGSLRDNLTMFKNIGDDEIIYMMKKIGLEKYANKESLGKEMTNIENLFSGGEARRLMIARSILRNTPILILDEPLANLDPNSCQKIEEILANINDKYIFIITHQKLEKEESVSKTIYMDKLTELNSL